MFEQASGISDGQGSLVYCSPWGCRVRPELNCLFTWEMKDFGNIDQSYSTPILRLKRRIKTKLLKYNHKNIDKSFSQILIYHGGK